MRAPLQHFISCIHRFDCACAWHMTDGDQGATGLVKRVLAQSCAAKISFATGGQLAHQVVCYQKPCQRAGRSRSMSGLENSRMKIAQRWPCSQVYSVNDLTGSNARLGVWVVQTPPAIYSAAAKWLAIACQWFPLGSNGRPALAGLA